MHLIIRGIDFTLNSRNHLRAFASEWHATAFHKGSGYGDSTMSTTDSCGNTARRRGWTRGEECRGCHWRAAAVIASVLAGAG